MTLPGIDANGHAAADHLKPTRYEGLSMLDTLSRVEALETQMAALTERVTTLEDAPAARERDDLSQKILEFLRRYPGLKFTAPVIAENLGEPAPLTHSRMKALTNQGLVLTEKREDGRTRHYHVPADD